MRLFLQLYNVCACSMHGNTAQVSLKKVFIILYDSHALCCTHFNQSTVIVCRDAIHIPQESFALTWRGLGQPSSHLMRTIFGGRKT